MSTVEVLDNIINEMSSEVNKYGNELTDSDNSEMIEYQSKIQELNMWIDKIHIIREKCKDNRPSGLVNIAEVINNSNRKTGENKNGSES